VVVVVVFAVPVKSEGVIHIVRPPSDSGAIKIVKQEERRRGRKGSKWAI
jgi:hypothetical protein